VRMCDAQERGSDRPLTSPSGLDRNASRVHGSVAWPDRHAGYSHDQTSVAAQRRTHELRPQRHRDAALVSYARTTLPGLEPAGAGNYPPLASADYLLHRKNRPDGVSTAYDQ